ncbi:MAG: DUF1223 domain-containing protein [Phycisphaeraceae bacterium]|nr:DUF1223 domain-containing protein [Phycisphaeraceae bacterium]
MIAVVMSLLGIHLAVADPESGARASEMKPAAVVELFTSEGCSSCPPADKLLAELIDEHAKAGDLIALSFHVDYWNNLGWKDPWSSPGATQRQQEYRDSLGDQSLYTPELVVGGKVGFVGSDRARAEREIAAELLRPKPIPVSATAKWKETSETGRQLHVVVRLGKSDKIEKLIRKWTVLVAVTEKGLSSDVRRGENAGRKLSHQSVVRVSKTIESELNTKPEIDFAIPADLQVDRASVVVLVQASPGKPIEGASHTELVRAEPATP